MQQRWQSVPRMQVQLGKYNYRVSLHQQLEASIIVLGNDRLFAGNPQLMFRHDFGSAILHKVLRLR